MNSYSESTYMDCYYNVYSKFTRCSDGTTSHGTVTISKPSQLLNDVHSPIPLYLVTYMYINILFIVGSLLVFNTFPFPPPRIPAFTLLPFPFPHPNPSHGCRACPPLSLLHDFIFIVLVFLSN